MSDAAPIAILVEDEPQIRRFVRTALETEGWHVCEAATLKDGLVEAGTRKPDVVILDLGLPDGDGIDFIRDLRTWSAIPVIVLSARVHETDKIKALDAGADDYLAKPFGVGELLARVRAVLRRKVAAGSEKLSVFRFGDVEVDLIKRVGSQGRRGSPPHRHRISATFDDDFERGKGNYESSNTARSLGAVVCSA